MTWKKPKEQKKLWNYSNIERIDTIQYEEKLSSCVCKASKQCKLVQSGGGTEYWARSYLHASEQNKQTPKTTKKKYSLGGWRTDADPNCRREGGTEQQRFCCFHGHFSAWPHCETTLKPLQWGSFLFSFQIFPSKVMTTHIVPHICSSLINWLLRDDSLHTFFFFHFSTLFIVHQSTDLGDRFCIWQRRCGWG